MKRLFLMAVATVSSGLIATLLGSGSGSAAAQIGGLAPCWCCATVSVTPSSNCNCTLYIDNGLVGSVSCAIIGNPNCPLNSARKCVLDADFREDLPCGGFYPDIAMNTQCDTTKSVDTPDCNGNSSEHHTITLLCDPCRRIPGGCPPVGP